MREPPVTARALLFFVLEAIPQRGLIASAAFFRKLNLLVEVVDGFTFYK
jgi:hypothetical protein